MATSPCVELKVKDRKGTERFLCKGWGSSSILWTECRWDQELKDNWKKLETGRGAGEKVEANAQRPEQASSGHAPEALWLRLQPPLAALGDAAFPTPSLGERKWSGALVCRGPVGSG